MAETTWDYTLQDFSPLFVYSSAPNNGNPQVANLDPVWNQTCPYEPAGPLNNQLCDVSSVHTTSAVNATVSLAFHGQAVQLFGTVANGVQYDVDVDGSVTTGQPSSGLLADVSGLNDGDHTVSLTIAPASSGTLSLTGGRVIVGTGLTGATVTRTIVQDSDQLISYAGAWGANKFDDWNITHTPDNSTWHQLNWSQPGSCSLSASGSAVLVYGVSWSFYPTMYRMTIGSQAPSFYSSSSTLPSTSHGRIYTNGLLFAQTDLSASQTLTFDNNNGAGEIGLDYVEMISVSGGSPITTSRPSSGSSSTVSSHSSSRGSSGSTNTAGPNQSGQPYSSSGSTSTSNGPSSSSSHSSRKVAAVVGPVIGALALLSLLLIGLYYCRRRRRATLYPTHGSSLTPFWETHSQTASVPSSWNPAGQSASSPSPTPFPARGRTATSGKFHRQAGPGAASVDSGTAPTTGDADVPSGTEIQAIRRDIHQLMQLVGRPGSVSDGSPPVYSS